MPKQQRWPKGSWMKLTSQKTLRALMEQRQFSLGKLARYAGCSKGFISHLLADPPRKRTCTPQLAVRIAEALEVPLEILFVPSTSSEAAQTVSRSAA